MLRDLQVYVVEHLRRTSGFVGGRMMDLSFAKMFVYTLALRHAPHKLRQAQLHKKIRNTSYITCRPDL